MCQYSYSVVSAFWRIESFIVIYFISNCSVHKVENPSMPRNKIFWNCVGLWSNIIMQSIIVKQLSRALTRVELTSLSCISESPSPPPAPPPPPWHDGHAEIHFHTHRGKNTKNTVYRNPQQLKKIKTWHWALHAEPKNAKPFFFFLMSPFHCHLYCNSIFFSFAR